MARNKDVIPLAPLIRVLKKHGARRVSKEAAEAFGEIITEIAKDISTRAIQLSQHSGRKTVKEEDIKLAAQRRRQRH